MLKVMLLAGVIAISLAACGGSQAIPVKPDVQMPDDVEPQSQNIRLTTDLEAEIRQLIRNEMALIASSTAVTATSTGFLPAQMHFALIEVINSVVKKLEDRVSLLATQISDNAFSFDEYSYYLSSEMNDMEYRVTMLEESVNHLVTQIDCMVAEINRAERFEDISFALADTCARSTNPVRIMTARNQPRGA